MSLKRFPRRTQSGAAEPCCCWSPLNVTQHELTLLKNQQSIFKVRGIFPHHEVSDPKVELIDQQQREVEHLSSIPGTTEVFHVIFFYILSLKYSLAPKKRLTASCTVSRHWGALPCWRWSPLTLWWWTGEVSNERQESASGGNTSRFII